MTLSISQSAHDQMFDEMSAVEPIYHPDPTDTQDFMGQFPPLMGKGYWRTIRLRDGLEVTLAHLQVHDRILTAEHERVEAYLEFHIHLSGIHENEGNLLGPGQYSLCGIGLMPKLPLDISDRQPFLEVQIYIREDVLRSFIANCEGELPPALQPWVGSPDRPRYACFAKATPAMQVVAREMLRCSFQGLPKRMILEGKCVEMLGLAAAAEMTRHHNDRPPRQLDLLDRLHHARDILRQQLDNPPNLAELARLVGLNECTLKQGFRKEFGTTAFGYLYDYRMQQARQALELGDWSVGEVARMVGYTNLAAFSRAFSKRFNLPPRDCLPR
ncbi:AraC family transcriptional regulator [Microcoleus sp. herbarium19]|uniref:helix-turn-helix transcriptional regulator n=1 Tax=unclassified Microcoleus TaxID=2642155 RepID=UPI002FD0CB3F